MPSSSGQRPPRRSTHDKGQAYERLAAEFFEQQGFEVVARNWRGGRREIDLVVQRKRLLIFVEVKAALSDAFGHPAERVDQRKMARLTRAARQFMVEREVSDCDVRFDVVTFASGRLEHYPNAFEAAE
jgi:putative endonuclease